MRAAISRPGRSLDAAQNDGFAAARRQTIQRRLQPAQFIARDGGAFGARRVDRDIQRFQIGDRFDGNDLLVGAHDRSEDCARS